MIPREVTNEGTLQMNATQRKELSDIVAQLESVKSTVEDHGNEEREKFDNMPEGFQVSERGERTEAAADALEEALNAIEEAIACINQAIEG